MKKRHSLVIALLSSSVALAQDAAPTRVDAPTIKTAPAFNVELIYEVPKGDQGSWVALAHDPKGRIIASDQYGSLYRVTPPDIGSSSAAKVEQLKVTLRTEEADADDASTEDDPSYFVGAHGLLYAFDSLYAMVTEAPDKQGLWRLRDTNGDDQFDETKYLRAMNGGGEHGPHSLALSPDGKSIYFANGNHTDLPANLESSRPVRWGEDHLLPRMWDARGHARGKYAPGGYIARTDPDGEKMELFAIGFRNQFDLAFDQNGELFTYDSDMEWDLGTPWYMPTRVNHVVDAGDYGWRSGAGRWPEYYIDSLPAVIELGPGSPTGTTFGTGAKFPAKYQRAFFGADWTYGTLYAIHLRPDGSTYRGEKEEFLFGKPLPLTDVIVNPHDGALYFAVGGRRTESALYRVTYVGAEDTAPAKPAPLTPEVEIRRSLEALHAEDADPRSIDYAWSFLSHEDRFIRFAARAAIERQLTSNWAERALSEDDPQAAIEALTALARVGEHRYQPLIIDALSRIEFAKLPANLRLPLLRAWQLTFTRMGKPDAETRARIAKAFDPLFPHANPLVNRELVSLLVYLDSPTVVAKTVPLLKIPEEQASTAEELGGERLTARNERYGNTVQEVAEHRPDRQQIAYAYALRHATVGWSPKLRHEFFSWFPRTISWRGGASFTGFIDNIRKDALEQVADPGDRLALSKLSQPPAHSMIPDAVAPKGPGRDYTVEEATALIPAKLSGRDFEQGKAMFNSTACIACHRFNGVGSGIGPDLSAAGNRYTVRDLLENIIEPSRVISDQYGSERIALEDGSTVIGRVVGEEDGRLLVMANPFTPNNHVRVRIDEVVSRKKHPHSMMPPGLINGLNPEELKDLVAYMLSAGNPNDPMFAPAE